MGMEFIRLSRERRPEPCHLHLLRPPEETSAKFRPTRKRMEILQIVVNQGPWFNAKSTGNIIDIREAFSSLYSQQTLFN